MKRIKIHCQSLEELPEVAKKIIKFSENNDIWRFDGEMGAGKTTLIKAISEELGIIDNVNSPTFSIVNEYLAENDETYYHFDFYRLEKEEEALDIGIEDYFYSGNICFLEWASNIENLLPLNYIQIDISVQEDNSRFITLSENK